MAFWKRLLHCIYFSCAKSCGNSLGTVDLLAFFILSAMSTGMCGLPETPSLALVPCSYILFWLWNSLTEFQFVWMGQSKGLTCKVHKLYTCSFFIELTLCCKVFQFLNTNQSPKECLQSVPFSNIPPSYLCGGTHKETYSKYRVVATWYSYSKKQNYLLAHFLFSLFCFVLFPSLLRQITVGFQITIHSTHIHSDTR